MSNSMEVPNEHLSHPKPLEAMKPDSASLRARSLRGLWANLYRFQALVNRKI